jgi:hypothetical protein
MTHTVKVITVKLTVGRNIPVYKTQSEGIFQYKSISEQGFSGTKYSDLRGILVQNMQSVRYSSKKHIQLVGIFQYKIQSGKILQNTYSVRRYTPVQNIQ